MHISIFVALIIMLAPHAVLAQEHEVYCNNVDGTASSQECLTKHLKSAQGRLNKIYVKLGEVLEKEPLVELKELQKIWLTYRDAECMWEAGRSEEMGLKRITELSCMARVTEDRVDLLTVAYGDNAHPEIQRQLGAFPRWMNVVAKQYPAIYWNYGVRLKEDINCDGQDEHIMTGLTIEGERFNTYLTIVEAPLIGKPKPTLFTFLIGNDVENSICNNDVKIEIQKTALPEALEEIDKVCPISLILRSKQCPSQTINWTGKAFHLTVEKDIIDKKEKKN